MGRDSGATGHLDRCGTTHDCLLSAVVAGGADCECSGHSCGDIRGDTAGHAGFRVCPLLGGLAPGDGRFGVRRTSQSIGVDGGLRVGIDWLARARCLGRSRSDSRGCGGIAVFLASMAPPRLGGSSCPVNGWCTASSRGRDAPSRVRRGAGKRNAHRDAGASIAGGYRPPIWRVQFCAASHPSPTGGDGHWKTPWRGCHACRCRSQHWLGCSASQNESRLGALILERRAVGRPSRALPAGVGAYAMCGSHELGLEWRLVSHRSPISGCAAAGEADWPK